MGYAVALTVGLVLGASITLASLTLGRLSAPKTSDYRTPPPTHRDTR